MQFKQTAKGTAYCIVKSNPGEKIKVGQIVTFNLVQKTERDSILASTYVLGRPFQAQIAEQGDLMDIFPLLAVNDSVVIKVPSDSIFKANEDKRPPFFPKGSNLMISLKVEKIQSLEDAMAERNKAMEEQKAYVAQLAKEEPAIMNKYIADNKLALKTTVSGLKYVVTKASTLRKPVTGDTVYVNYKGSTLDGRVFDTSIEAEAEKAGIKQDGRPYEPLAFILGVKQVIPGWDEGLKLLGVGSKATFIIPSKLAYGENGTGQAIPPYSTLRFDVELVKVVPAKHAPVKKPVAKASAAKPSPVKKPAAAPAKKVVAPKH